VPTAWDPPPGGGTGPRPHDSIQVNTSSLRSSVVVPDEIDGMRRSAAIGGTWTRTDIERLLGACAAVLAQRAVVVAVLEQLVRHSARREPPSTSWARIVGGK
jgi:hypothetical protein